MEHNGSDVRGGEMREKGFRGLDDEGADARDPAEHLSGIGRKAGVCRHLDEKYYDPRV